MRLCGGWRSENVGTSNRNSGESPEHRKPKVSLAMVINQGLGGPKGKPKGVPDGQLVNIPALRNVFSLKRRKLVVESGYRIPVLSMRGNPSGEGKQSFGRANFDEQLSQKIIKEAKTLRNRTANRHRWVGVIVPRCTSETSLRNSANKWS